jgi:hypothetical protein
MEIRPTGVNATVSSTTVTFLKSSKSKTINAVYADSDSLAKKESTYIMWMETTPTGGIAT